MDIIADKTDSDIEKVINELPDKAKSAIFWVITHFDLVEKMCKDSKMTNEEIEKHMVEARAKEDYTMLALLCCAQIYQKGNETKKQEN